MMVVVSVLLVGAGARRRGGRARHEAAARLRRYGRQAVGVALQVRGAALVDLRLRRRYLKKSVPVSCVASDKRRSIQEEWHGRVQLLELLYLYLTRNCQALIDYASNKRVIAKAYSLLKNV